MAGCPRCVRGRVMASRGPKELPRGMTRRSPTKNFPGGSIKVIDHWAAGKTVTKQFPDTPEGFRDAKGWIESRRVDRHRGAHEDPNRARQKVLSYIGEWYDLQSRTKQLGERQRQQEGGWIRNHLTPCRIAGLRMGDVRTHHAEQWVADMMDNDVPNYTLFRTFRLVAAGFRRAHSRGDIKSNPFDNNDLWAVLPDHSRKKVPMIWTPDQIVDIADCHPPRYRALILVWGFVGIRLNEATGLFVTDWDKGAHRFWLQRQYDRGRLKKMKNWKAREKRMPNGYRPYVIPIVEDALRLHIERGYTGTFQGNTLMFGAGWGGKPRQMPVFTSVDGVAGQCAWCGRPTPIKRSSTAKQAPRRYCDKACQQMHMRERYRTGASPAPVSVLAKYRDEVVPGAGVGSALAIPGFERTTPRFAWNDRPRPDAPPISDGTAWSTFQSSLKRAGLPHGTIHDLRHSCASFWISTIQARAHGDPVAFVAAQLGDSEQMIRQTYGHLLESSRRAAEQAVATAYESILRPGMRPLAELGEESIG
jgi:hypothetical protein